MYGGSSYRSKKRKQPQYVEIESTGEKLARVASMAYKGLQVARSVAQVVNSELKYHDTNQTTFNLDDNGYVSELCNPGQGDTDQTITGDSILLKKIEVRGAIAYDSTLGGNQIVRIIIANDKQNDVSTTAMLESYGSAQTVHMPKDHDLRFLSTVWYDKTFVVNSQHPCQLFKFKKVFKKPLHTQFLGDATSVLKNDPKIWMVSNSPNAGANFVSCEYYARISYHDN